MALSLREHDHFGAEALSAATVGNALIDRVYAKLTPIYDIIFGPILQPGRVAAVARMDLRPGDRVLEVGAGTGINAPLYPRDCQVTAIDLSSADARKGARAHRAAWACATCGCSRRRRAPDVRRRLVRQRVCALHDQRRARSGAGGA